MPAGIAHQRQEVEIRKTRERLQRNAAQVLEVPLQFVPRVMLKLPDQLSVAPGLDTARQEIGVYAWWDANRPQPGGSLVFAVTIMTSTQGSGLSPMPLLVLDQLTLNYSDWGDHPTSASGG